MIPNSIKYKAGIVVRLIKRKKRFLIFSTRNSRGFWNRRSCQGVDGSPTFRMTTMRSAKIIVKWRESRLRGSGA